MPAAASVVSPSPGIRPTPGRLKGEQHLRHWSRSRDPRSRDAAIASYMPLARRLAKRYDHGRVPFEDLSQVAYIGLVKAVDRFDPEIGVSFASFAVPTITGELRRHFRDHSWALRVPRGLQEDVLKVRHATDDLTEHLGRAPTVSELSRATALDAEQIAEALQALTAKDTTSLDQPMSDTDGDSTATLGDLLGGDDDGFALVDDRTTIAPALRALPRRDREMLYMRFALDMTQSEIGQQLGCSQMQVSRLLRRALETLGKPTVRACPRDRSLTHDGPTSPSRDRADGGVPSR